MSSAARLVDPPARRTAPLDEQLALRVRRARDAPPVACADERVAEVAAVAAKGAEEGAPSHRRTGGVSDPHVARRCRLVQFVCCEEHDHVLGLEGVPHVGSPDTPRDRSAVGVDPLKRRVVAEIDRPPCIGPTQVDGSECGGHGRSLPSPPHLERHRTMIRHPLPPIRPLRPPVLRAPERLTCARPWSSQPTWTTFSLNPVRRSSQRHAARVRCLP
jgi:hypothetical protein